MVLRTVRLFRTSCRFVHSADTYEGRVLPKTKIIQKIVRRDRGKCGGRFMVTLLPGVSPGPQLMSYVKDVFEVARVPVDFEEIPYKGTEDEEETAEFGQYAITSLHRNGVGLKGNIHNVKNMISTNVTLRSQLDLYVCVVHIKSYPNVKCKFPNLDIILFRQNTEGEYAMLEHSAKPGVVESLKIITKENTTRFAEWCFEFALQEKRKHVVIVHKANIMKLSDGLFLQVVKDVGKNFPQLQLSDMIVDNASMKLVQNPMQFDVLISPNLYGNILTNIACGLTGGPGLMSGANYGPGCAVFEAGSRHLTYMAEDNVNPVAMLNASVEVLDYLGLQKHASVIDRAIEKTLSEDRVQTKDLGGTATPDEVVERVLSNIEDIFKRSDVKMF